METTLTRRRWLAPLILFGLALLLLEPAVLPDNPRHALAGNDFTGNFYPLYSFTSQQIAAGNLPLWNPRQFAGFPVAGNPQAAIFYPGTWLLWGMTAGLDVSVPRAIGVLVMLHVFLAAWGMYVLARAFGITAVGALAAAVIYSMSGWAGSRVYAGHYTILTVFAWIPFALAGYHIALGQRTWASLLAPTVFLGLAALAGHPQMVLYAALGLGALWLYHTLTAEDMLPAARAGLWRLAVVGMGGIVLGLALLLPTAELVSQTARTDTTLAFVDTFRLPAAQLATLALPFLYGNPEAVHIRYWGADFFEETTAYAGLLALVALPLVLRLGDRRVWLWAGLAGLGLGLALGADGVLFALLVRWVPGFSLFRAPGRFLYFVTLGLAGVTGLLLTHLQAATPDERRTTLAPALRALPYIGAALLAGSVFFSGWYASASHVEPMPIRATQIAGVLGYAAVMTFATWGVLHLLAGEKRFNTGLLLALALITWDVWRVALPVITTSDVNDANIWQGGAVTVPPDETNARVVAFANPDDYYTNPVNIASTTGHQHLKGYDPLEISRYAALEAAAAHNPNHPLYRLMGLRYVFSWEPRADAGWELIGVNNDAAYYENPDPFPRAWVTTDALLEPDLDAALERMASSEIDLRGTAVLHAPLDCATGGEASARITDYQPNTVTIETAGDGGVLVLSDQYYPGWQATVDGDPVLIHRAYTTLRAVCVPAGERTVTFRYRPLSVRVGAAVSGVGWLLVGAAAVWMRRRP